MGHRISVILTLTVGNIDMWVAPKLSFSTQLYWLLSNQISLTQTWNNVSSQTENLERINRSEKFWKSFETFSAIWYHLYNFKKVKNTHGGVILLAKACNYTTSNTLQRVFFAFFKIVQMVPNRAKHHICSAIFVKLQHPSHSHDFNA